MNPIIKNRRGCRAHKVVRAPWEGEFRITNPMATVTDHLKSIPDHGVHAAFSTKDTVANTKMPHHMNSVEACGDQPQQLYQKIHVSALLTASKLLQMSPVP